MTLKKVRGGDSLKTGQINQFVDESNSRASSRTGRRLDRNLMPANPVWAINNTSADLLMGEIAAIDSTPYYGNAAGMVTDNVVITLRDTEIGDDGHWIVAANLIPQGDAGWVYTGGICLARLEAGSSGSIPGSLVEMVPGATYLEVGENGSGELIEDLGQAATSGPGEWGLIRFPAGGQLMSPGITGDLWYFNGNTWVKLGIGSPSQVLTVSGGLPAWGAGGGGGGRLVGETIVWWTTAPTGWLRCDSKTVGDGSSGATARANADAENLFVYLWNADASSNNLIVSGGKGASAAADWAAHKTITLPDGRRRGIVGRGSSVWDDMFQTEGDDEGDREPAIHSHSSGGSGTTDTGYANISTEDIAIGATNSTIELDVAEGSGIVVAVYDHLHPNTPHTHTDAGHTHEYIVGETSETTDWPPYLVADYIINYDGTP